MIKSETCCRWLSRESLSKGESPSFCNLRISSGFLYGLRASKCMRRSLRGRCCVALFLILLLEMITGREVLLSGAISETTDAGFRIWTFFPECEQSRSWKTDNMENILRVVFNCNYDKCMRYLPISTNMKLISTPQSQLGTRFTVHFIPIMT